MSLRGGRFSYRDFALNLGAVVLASVLFALAFPSYFFKNGLSFIAWFAFIPIFWLSYRVSLRSSFLWGALYGYGSYGLFNFWLSVFHPLAGIIVGFIYVGYFALLVPLLKLATMYFPRRAYIAHWILWIAYEYLKTNGFLAYAYGVSGYTQWSMVPLIQIADIFGVWGISALVVFPSAFFAAAFKNGWSGFPVFFKDQWISLVVWTIALSASLVYGYSSPVDYSQAPLKRISLIQHNTDPWRGGIKVYRENFNTLKRLSLEALAQDPKPDLVVWSETAFVPRIYWHMTYRDDPPSYALVKELLDFLALQEVPFLIGNDDGRKEVGESGQWERVDYNAVLLFDKGIEKAAYRKLHLVPFTEHFPYEKQFPAVYKALEAADTHFWKKGTEATVFESNGVRFSTPICFEDTFGYLSRRFTLGGAELIINLTNDAWANSLAAQMQHAAMAVFRAVENRRSLVRATASGQTCAIDPNGKIIAMADPFAEIQLTVDVPIITADTIYTRWGDFLGVIFVFGAFGSVAFGSILYFYRKGRIDKNG